jgi:hypothetical protein
MSNYDICRRLIESVRSGWYSLADMIVDLTAHAPSVAAAYANALLVARQVRLQSTPKTNGHKILS